MARRRASSAPSERKAEHVRVASLVRADTVLLFVEIADQPPRRPQHQGSTLCGGGRARVLGDQRAQPPHHRVRERARPASTATAGTSCDGDAGSDAGAITCRAPCGSQPRRAGPRRAGSGRSQSGGCVSFDCTNVARAGAARTRRLPPLPTSRKSGRGLLPALKAPARSTLSSSAPPGRGGPGRRPSGRRCG
jgi:hypothetical protein